MTDSGSCSKGRARFYDENDQVIGDLGPMQGILIEHNFPYWFEGTGDELLEILHVAARDPRVDPDERIDHRPRKFKGSQFSNTTA